MAVNKRNNAWCIYLVLMTDDFMLCDSRKLYIYVRGHLSIVDQM